jgi:hypothetical protein
LVANGRDRIGPDGAARRHTGRGGSAGHDHQGNGRLCQQVDSDNLSDRRLQQSNPCSGERRTHCHAGDDQRGDVADHATFASPGRAPDAIRIPGSFVRCATEDATTA